MPSRTQEAKNRIFLFHIFLSVSSLFRDVPDRPTIVREVKQGAEAECDSALIFREVVRVLKPVE